MKILKTLDRAAGFAGALSSVPMMGMMGVIVGTLESFSAMDPDNEDLKYLSNVSHALFKMMSRGAGQTMRYGYIGVLTNEDSLKQALREGIEFALDMDDVHGEKRDAAIVEGMAEIEKAMKEAAWTTVDGVNNLSPVKFVRNAIGHLSSTALRTGLAAGRSVYSSN